MQSAIFSSKIIACYWFLIHQVNYSCIEQPHLSYIQSSTLKIEGPIPLRAVASNELSTVTLTGFTGLVIGRNSSSVIG